jgi:hypothetical protein
MNVVFVFNFLVCLSAYKFLTHIVFQASIVPGYVATSLAIGAQHFHAA